MIPPRRWAGSALTLFRTFGVLGGSRRAVHELRKATGRFKTEPQLDLSGSTTPPSPFVIDEEALRTAVDLSAAKARAGRVLSGEFQAYRRHWRPLPNSPEDWVRCPGSSTPWSADAPWWRVPHLDSSRGDIKDVWEPARFGWVFDLIRAYLLTGDDRYAATFQRRFHDWHTSSPPYRGPHWSCGQEVAIRAIALLYAEAHLPLDGVANEVQATLAASGERIADAIGYALSQRNNHAISEAVGLVALGCRFGNASAEASGWLDQGHRLLERLLVEQFELDGWYIQHSFTYSRLALDQCVVAERCLRSIGGRLSETAVTRVWAGADLLTTILECESGIVPNHGPNDGAFVHPITMAPYRDFRPVISAVSALWRRPIPSDVAVDAEALAWVDGEQPTVAAARRDGLRVGPSGWAFVRTGPVEVFVRAGRYMSRPGHLDPLQIDVRCGGQEVLVDPGTFAYSGQPPWNNGLASHEVHNGPQVSGRPPGIKGPRFLWYRWPSADIVESSWDGERAVVVAEADTGVRRTIVAEAAGVDVHDELLDPGATDWRVYWLLHPDSDATMVTTRPGPQPREAADDEALGWFSPNYGERVPSILLKVEGPGAGDPHILTTIRALTDGHSAET